MIYIASGKSMATWHGLGFIKVQKLKDIPLIPPIKVNDVVIFKGNDNKRYAHRIIKLEDDHFTTKGDKFQDSKLYEINVPVENIESKVVWSYPKW